MDNVIDLNVRPVTKVMQNSPVLNDGTAVGAVSIIGCEGCGSEKFYLGDGARVICSGCNCLIEQLQWWDKDEPPSPRAA